MREKELHLVGNPSTGMRSANRDAMGHGEAEGVLRRREGTTRGSSAAGVACRGKSAMGYALVLVGLFWIARAVALVLSVWEVSK